MRKIIFAILFLIIPVSLFAQTGQLKLWVSVYSVDEVLRGKYQEPPTFSDSVNVVIDIKRETDGISVYRKEHLVYGSGLSEDTAIVPGKYFVLVTAYAYTNGEPNKSEKLEIRYDNVTVEEGRKTAVRIIGQFNESIEGDKDSLVFAKGGGHVRLLYNRDQFSLDDNFSKQFTVGAGAQGHLVLSKFIGVGGFIDYGLSFARFKGDSTINNITNHKRERYLGFNVPIGTYLHFTGYNNKIGSKFGLALDLGIMYDIPIYNRYMVKKGKETITTRGIHNFNDVKVFARLGHSFVQLTAEYRITNYTKSAFPDPPPIMVGLAVNIDYDIKNKVD